MNHWRLISGSMRFPLRCEYGTVWTNSERETISPSASSASMTAAWASSVVSPANRPGRLGHPPSSPIALISSRPCLRPISKSLGSWPG